MYNNLRSAQLFTASMMQVHSLMHSLTLWMLGNFLIIDYIVVCSSKPLNSACILLEMIDWVANRLDLRPAAELLFKVMITANRTYPSYIYFIDLHKVSFFQAKIYWMHRGLYCICHELYIKFVLRLKLYTCFQDCFNVICAESLKLRGNGDWLVPSSVVSQLTFLNYKLYKNVPDLSGLTLSLPNTLSSAKFLVYFNFQIA